MMPLVRPTLILDIDLDERAYTPDCVASLKRSYQYISLTRVASHPAGGQIPEHIMRMTLKLHRACWESSAAGADDQWQQVMQTWLHNMFYKVSSTMVAYNKMRAENGDEPLVFSWLEIDFGGKMLVRVHLAADSAIPDTTLSWVNDTRESWNAGTWGSDVVAVSIPSAASFAAQAAPHIVERVIEPETEDAAADVGVEGEETPGAEAVAAPAADEAGSAEKAPAATAEDSLTTDAGGEVPAEADAEAEAPEPQVVFELEPFDIDYSVWGIAHADGTMEEIHG